MHIALQILPHPKDQLKITRPIKNFETTKIQLKIDLNYEDQLNNLKNK